MRRVDPLLLFILELVIIAAMLYLYLWLRAVSRRVEDRELDAKLDDLEESVAETTRWLERASHEIREDIQERTQGLQRLLAEAEELVETVRRSEAFSTPRDAGMASPAATEQAPTRGAPEAGADAEADSPEPSRRSGDESADVMPGQTLVAQPPGSVSEKEADASELSGVQEPSAWRPPEIEQEVSALIDAAVADAEQPNPNASETAAPVVDALDADDGDEHPEDPAERRLRILALVKQDLEPGVIAAQVGASRAEVEMVAALHRRRPS